MPKRLDIEFEAFEDEDGNRESIPDPTITQVTNADRQGWIEMDLNEPFAINVGEHIRVLYPLGTETEIIEGYFDGVVRYDPITKAWEIQIRTGDTDAVQIALNSAIAVKIKG